MSHDGKFLMIFINNGLKQNQIKLVDLMDDENRHFNESLKTEPLINNWVGLFDYVHNIGRKFYFKTNAKAPFGHVVELDATDPIIDNVEDVWKVVIPESKCSFLQSAVCSGGKLATIYLENAHEKFRIFDFNSNHLKDVNPPDIGTIVGMSAKYNSNELFYSFNSFTDPKTLCRIDLKTFKQKVVANTPLKHISNVKYKTDQVWIPSKDGT